MKVPPKRKGNVSPLNGTGAAVRSLNESPSEKEGKSRSRGERSVAPGVPQ